MISKKILEGITIKMLRYFIFFTCILIFTGVSFAANVENINQTSSITDTNTIEPVNTNDNSKISQDTVNNTGTTKTLNKVSTTTSGSKAATQTTTKTRKIYVDPTANVKLQDGSSTHPYTTIQTAVSKCANAYDNIIYLSKGNHILNSTVQIAKTVTIIGKGKYATNITCLKNQGFRISKGANLTLQSLRMQNASYSQGGAILASANTRITIKSCIFTNNYANNGGVLFTSGNEVTGNIINSRFDSNTAVRFGAALQLGGYGSVYNVINCTFYKNVLTDTNFGHSTGGAAIYASNFGTVNINNSVFKANQALWGNAVLNGNHATLTVTYSNFTSNVAKKSSNEVNVTKGGAIAIGSGYAEVGNCIFTSNKADVCGAITINSGETTYIYSCQFQSNKAYIQGGALNNYGTLHLYNSTFNKNTAYKRGGAILDIGINEISIDKCTFTNNKVSTTFIANRFSLIPQGGAISILGNSHTFKLTNSTFVNNKAYFGGAIFSNPNVKWVTVNDCQFKNNDAHYGGAILVAGETTLDIRYDDFRYNHAYKQGGAILINGSVRGSFEYTKFWGNRANGTGTGQGGAVYICCYTRLDFNHCVFYSNVAKLRGGVIYSAYVSKISIAASNITYNSARKGSVMYLDTAKGYKNTTSKTIIDTSAIIGNWGTYAFYSTIAFDRYNNNTIRTSWWGTNEYSSSSVYNFNVNTRILMTFNLNDQVITQDWSKSSIVIKVNRTLNAEKSLILSSYTINETDTLRYTDAFLPPRKFSVKEGSKKQLNPILYVYYHLDMSVNTIKIKVDLQEITIKIVD